MTALHVEPQSPARFQERLQSVQPHILIVEDQESLAGNLEELLSLEGFEVTRVADGRDAVEVAKKVGADAVVLDVMLPGLDGFEVCRMLRSDPATSRMVIVMLTALDDTGSKLEGLEGGADDYLVKPVPARELVARLRRRLGHNLARAEEVRRQRLEAISQIAAAVSHEVNNPLTAALGTLDLLLVSHELPGEVQDEIRQCQHHLTRIGRIVSRLAAVEDRTVPYLGSRKMIDLRVNERIM